MIENYTLKIKLFLAFYCLVATHSAEKSRNQSFPLKFMNFIIIVEQKVEQQKNPLRHVINNSITEDSMISQIINHSMTYSTECKFLSQNDVSN